MARYRKLAVPDNSVKVDLENAFLTFKRNRGDGVTKYRAILEGMGVTDDVVQSSTVQELDGIIPSSVRDQVCKGMMEVGIATKRSSEREKSDRLRSVALGYLLYPCEKGKRSSVLLLNLGQTGVIFDPKGVELERAQEESIIGEDAFLEVLAKYVIGQDHFDGKKPMTDFKINDKDARDINWALGSLSLLTYRMAAVYGINNRGDDEERCLRKSLAYHQTHLSTYNLPRDIIKVSHINSTTFDRLDDDAKKDLILRMGSLGYVYYHMGDKPMAYHAYALALGLQPDRGIFQSDLKNLSREDPGIDETVMDMVGDKEVEVKTPFEVLTSSPPKPERLPKTMKVKVELTQKQEETGGSTYSSWSEARAALSGDRPGDLCTKLGFKLTVLTPLYKSASLLSADQRTPFKSESKELLADTLALEMSGGAGVADFLSHMEDRALHWSEATIGRDNLCPFLGDKSLADTVNEKNYPPLTEQQKKAITGIVDGFQRVRESVDHQLGNDAVAIEEHYRQLLVQIFGKIMNK
jgi:hypothetical protein